MGVTAPLPQRRDALMRLPIGELSTWHLMAACAACRQDRVVSIKSLVERYGSEITLLPIVPRLRCGMPHCRLPPSRLRLRNKFPQHPGPTLIEVLLWDRSTEGWPGSARLNSPRPDRLSR